MTSERLALPIPAKDCDWCGDDLDKKGSYPPTLCEGQPICDDCFHEHYEFDCIRCGSSDLIENRHHLVILEKCGGLTPGIYFIKDRPYFTSNYFDMWWNPWALSRIKDADGRYLNEFDYPSGHLCYGCLNELGIVERVGGTA